MADKLTSRGEEEDDYDPVEHRPPGPRTSDFAALMHLMKCSIGTGILFLPNGFRRAGYATSVISSIIIGLVCTHTVVGLVRCAQVLCRRNRIPMLDFAETAELSFQSGPERIRKYGKTFGIITNFFVCFVQYECAVVYILYVATSFQQVIEFFSGFEMDVRIYILSLFPFVCGLAFVPHLKYLTPFSAIGFFFMLNGISVSLYYLVDDFPDPGRLNTFTQVLPVPMYCAMFLFAMHNTTYCMPLENTMEHPRHLPMLLTFNMVFNMCIYTIFGFLGYNKYADTTCDTVIKNLPIEETLAQVVKITISLSVMFSFGLAYYVPHTILRQMLEAKLQTIKHGEALLRLISVAVTMLLAIAVPEMVPLLGLLAALSVTTIMLLIPVLIETATRWTKATKLLFTKNIVILLLWMLLLIFGAIESLRSIVREYRDVKERGC